MTHSEPSGKRLRHIGFYAAHGKTRFNDPIGGSAAARELELEETGTALHILGFSAALRRWRDMVAKSAVGSFFFAIFKGWLDVAIVEESGEERVIDKDALPLEFERLSGVERARITR